MSKKIKITLVIIGIIVIAAIIGTFVYFNVGENKTIAKVKQYRIRQKDLTKELEIAKNNIKEQSPDISDAELNKTIESYKKQALDQLINDKIFELKAKELNLIPDKDKLNTQIEEQFKSFKDSFGSEDGYKKYVTQNNITDNKIKEDITSQIISNYLFEYMFKSIKSPTDSEIKDYYTKNKDKYITNPGANIYHVYAKTEDKINEIYKEIKSGLKFADAAKKYNTDGTQSNSGFLGYMTYDAKTSIFTKDIMNQISKLKEGEISAPIKSEYGYHILTVKNIVTTQKVLTLEEAKEQITNSIIEEQRNKIYEENISKWRKEYNITN